MSTENQASFNDWAKVEVMGHQSHIGKVTTQAFGQTVMFRIDSPEIPEREETLLEDRWTGMGRLPKGSVVKHGAIPPVTVIVGAASIYRIIPCTEEVAISSLIRERREEFSLLRAPTPRLSGPSAGTDGDEDSTESEIDEEEFMRG